MVKERGGGENVAKEDSDGWRAANFVQGARHHYVVVGELLVEIHKVRLVSAMIGAVASSTVDTPSSAASQGLVATALAQNPFGLCCVRPRCLHVQLKPGVNDDPPCHVPKAVRVPRNVSDRPIHVLAQR